MARIWNFLAAAHVVLRHATGSAQTRVDHRLETAVDPAVPPQNTLVATRLADPSSVERWPTVSPCKALDVEYPHERDAVMMTDNKKRMT